MTDFKRVQRMIIEWIKWKIYGKPFISWDVGVKDESVIIHGRVLKGVIKIDKIEYLQK